MITPNVDSSHHFLFAKLIAEDIHRMDLGRVPRATALTEEEKTLTSEQIKKMVTQAKEARTQIKTPMNQLATLLVDLYSAEASLDQICALFDQMDKDLFHLLCHLVCVVKNTSLDDPAYGDRCVRENPQLLLTIVNSKGENPIEMLINSQGVALDKIKQSDLFKGFKILDKSSGQIVNKKELIESYYQQLAKEIAATKPLDFDLIAEDENLAFEVAQIVAARNGGEVSRTIQSYGIKNQGRLCKIAEIAAAQCGLSISLYMKNYGIQDENLRFKIADIAATRGGGLFTVCIENFEIKNQDRLFEIVQKAASKNGMAVSISIKNYGIESTERLFAIAKTAVAQDEANVINYLKEYRLPDAKIQVCQWLAYLGMLIKHTLTPRVQKSLESDMECKRIKEAKEIEEEKKIKELEVSMTEMEKEFGEKQARDQVLFQKDQVKVNQLKQSLMRRHIFYRLRQSLFAEKNKKMPKDLEAAFQAVFEYRNTRLAGDLTCFLCEAQSFDDKYVTYYNKLVNGNGYLSRAMIVLAKWILELKSEPEGACLLTNIRGPFKDKDSGVEHTWLQTLLIMDKSSLTLSKKHALIVDALSCAKGKKAGVKERGEELKTRLQLIQALCDQGQTDCLEKTEFTKEMTQELQTLFAGNLAADHFINLKEVKDLSTKYIKTFGASRHPLAWKIYEGRIQKLQDDQVQKQFERFMLSVLEDTFTAERYQTKGNPHLMHLQEQCSDLLVKWGMAQTIKAIDASSKDVTVVDTDNWEDLFLSGTEVSGSCQRVDEDASINKSLLAYVMDGKNRMLAVKNEFGRILARSMFRLLWDDKTQKPVLFQDRIYPPDCSAAFVLDLNRHAETRAKELGCALVTRNSDRKGMSDYPGTAVSLGSSCPYDYQDATGGIMEEGKFRIDQLKQVLKI